MIQRYLYTLALFICALANRSAAQISPIFCTSSAVAGTNDLSDIGGFSFGSFVNTTGGPHLSNPTAVETYTDYTSNNITAYTDSAYYIEVYHTLKGNAQVDAKVTLFIDFNNNGIFEPGTEKVWVTNTNSNNIYVHTTLTVPTGSVTLGAWLRMRVILNNYLAPSAASDSACGTYTSGETEDYKIRFLQHFRLAVPETVLSAERANIYPNPSAGNFTVDLGGYNNPVNITVADLAGRVVYSQANVSCSTPIALPLAAQTSGIYQLLISSGNQHIVLKLIKQ